MTSIRATLFRAARGTVIAAVALLVATLGVDQARAQQRLKIDLIGDGPGADSRGAVFIIDNPSEPDQMNLFIRKQPPNVRVTVFLTRHQDRSKLPAQFIGEFTTDADGSGNLHLHTEIVDAFSSANQTLEDAFGEADVFGAGDLPVPNGGTANTIPLNWFRGYFVDEIDGIPPHNVFGPDENTPGGAIAFISDPSLP